VEVAIFASAMDTNTMKEMLLDLQLLNGMLQIYPPGSDIPEPGGYI
jgi:hypothetical protein